MIDVNEINLDAIRSTITFLSENEEYGDDWSTEIATLDKVIDFCLEHGHRDDRQTLDRAAYQDVPSYGKFRVKG